MEAAPRPDNDSGIVEADGPVEGAAAAAAAEEAAPHWEEPPAAAAVAAAAAPNPPANAAGRCKKPKGSG